MKELKILFCTLLINLIVVLIIVPQPHNEVVKQFNYLKLYRNYYSGVVAWYGKLENVLGVSDSKLVPPPPNYPSMWSDL